VSPSCVSERSEWMDALWGKWQNYAKTEYHFI